MKLSLSFEDEYTGNKWEVPFTANDRLMIKVGEPKGPYGRILKILGGLPPSLNIQALLASILTTADFATSNFEAYRANNVVDINDRRGHDHARAAETS